MLDKLIGLVMIGSSLANVTLLHRFLSRAVVVVALAIVSSLLTATLLLGACYAAYYYLTYNGIAPQTAVSLVGIFIVIVTALMILAIAIQLRKIRELPRSSHPSPIPSFSQLGGVTEAFIDGLLCRPRINKAP